ncbi:hypothetical protein [Thalassobacterium sedimentorum]|nr:hypothetical protein [Coraliomargarita sp. SDUM461004]
MSKPSCQPTLHEQRCGGFALVMSLLLMSFVLMLILSISTLVQVEVMTSGQRSAMDDARQNAYLGMMVALGELQKVAGSDQRVTASADLLEDMDLSDSGAVASVLQPNWTGVWNRDGELLTWLVSGNQAKIPVDNDFFDPKESLSADQSVQLVGEFTSGQAGNAVEVYAPLVDVSDHSGSFAYWVGDEGVKAKANYRSVSLETELLSPENSELMGPRRLGVGWTEGMSWANALSVENFANLIGNSSLQLLANGDPTAELAVKERFHDLTVWSFGVLADVANGGLKQDLTAGLFGANAASELSGSMFEPAMGETPSLSNPGGPDWAQLRSWATTSGTNSLPVRETTNTQAGFYPVLSQAQLYFMPVYKADEGNAVYLYMMPAVTLWNPYDQPLETTDYTLTFARNLTLGNGSITTRRNPLEILRLKLQRNEDASLFDTTKIAPDRHSITLTIPSVTLAPGESKVFSAPAGKNEYVWRDVPAAGENELAPGFRAEGVFYCIAEDENSTGDGQNPTPSLKDDGDPLNAEVFDDYYWTGGKTGVLALFLHQGSGENLQPLQDVLFLSHESSTLSTQQMREFNEVLTSSVRQQQVVGFKFVRAYTDNTTTSTLPGKVKWLSALNPRAVVSGSAGRTYDDAAARNLSFYNQFFINGYDQSVANFGDAGFAGHDENINNVSRAVLFEASPGREGLWSIGQLMHAPLFRWEPDGITWGSLDERTYWREQYARFDNMIPSYAVGNSNANPFVVDLTSTFFEMPRGNANLERFGKVVYRYDYSYLLNEVLWDKYFLSTLPDEVTADTEAVNPRLIRMSGNSEFSIGLDDSAEHLMLDGAFNVNSTSIQAWQALLTSYYGLPVTLSDSSVSNNDDAVPFIRTSEPVGLPVTVNNINPTRQNTYNGYRNLSLEQIEDLSQEIVRQIRLRGPFTSMADFVNRSLNGSDNESLQLRGALAAAIDNAGINAGLQKAYTEAESLELAPEWANSSAEAGWTNEQVPGWLSQADLMSRIGNTMSARSDTFRIRSYGESAGIGDSMPNRVWCEAIVQRVPEYVDASDVPNTSLADINNTNSEFGRRFEIVSFRWLTEEEI